MSIKIGLQRLKQTLKSELDYRNETTKINDTI
jgi:hypothetical protein